LKSFDPHFRSSTRGTVRPLRSFTKLRAGAIGKGSFHFAVVFQQDEVVFFVSFSQPCWFS
jgi:hypothetical protein